MSALKQIRLHCLGCVGTSNEVKNCQITSCQLYAYRFGTDPFRAKRVLTDEQKQALAERLKKARG